MLTGKSIWAFTCITPLCLHQPSEQKHGGVTAIGVLVVVLFSIVPTVEQLHAATALLIVRARLISTELTFTRHVDWLSKGTCEFRLVLNEKFFEAPRAESNGVVI